MNMRSRIISITIALVLMLTVVSGLGKGGALAAETRTIMDQNGREVKIPAEINRIVCTRILPFPAVYFLASGSCDKLVGIHPASKSAAEHSMLSVIAPEIMNAKTNFVKGADVNMEELLKLKPDIVFFYGDIISSVKQFDASEIPAVAIKTMTVADGNSLETLNSWLKLLGKIIEKEERTDEIIAYGYQALGMINSRIWNIPDEEKPKGLMIFRHGEKEIDVSGSHFFGHFWLEATGARDVAEEIKVKALVNMEQIYKWDPEIIYITNFTETQPQDLINNTIKGQDWSKVKAVKEGKVYKIPLGIYRWFPPSGDAPLMLKWLAQKNHPELFSDYAMGEEISKYYLRFYNYNLSEEQIKMILNPVRAAAKGYK
ncbi:ABC transporter substrate-binding protein [candidate division WOR-3 bacterium]|nr:ABC transporter substrate-binding protein [candidate division WOR-3 bacterium]